MAAFAQTSKQQHVQRDLSPIEEESPNALQEASLIKRFERVQLRTPLSMLPAAFQSQMPGNVRTQVPGLTPILEDFAELYLSSQKKKPRDDFELSGGRSQQVETQPQVLQGSTEVHKQLLNIFESVGTEA